MVTSLIGEQLENFEKSHGGSLNHRVGGLMHITVQTRYDLEYLTMRLSGYMNEPTEPDFLAIKHGMEYLMHHQHEPIMYSRKKFYKNHEISHQCLFKAGDAEINKNQEQSNFLHTYCDADHARYIYRRLSVTSTVYLFNETLIYWFSNKQSETSRRSSNSETIEMYKGVLDKNWIINFFRPIGYPIVPQSKIQEDNQATIRRLLEDIITPQARPLNVLITAFHELHLRKIFEIAETRSNMQISDLNSKPNEKKPQGSHRPRDWNMILSSSRVRKLKTPFY